MTGPRRPEPPTGTPAPGGRFTVKQRYPGQVAPAEAAHGPGAPARLTSAALRARRGHPALPAPAPLPMARRPAAPAPTPRRPPRPARPGPPRHRPRSAAAQRRPTAASRAGRTGGAGRAPAGRLLRAAARVESPAGRRGWQGAVPAGLGQRWGGVLPAPPTPCPPRHAPCPQQRWRRCGDACPPPRWRRSHVTARPAPPAAWRRREAAEPRRQRPGGRDAAAGGLSGRAGMRAAPRSHVTGERPRAGRQR